MSTTNTPDSPDSPAEQPPVTPAQPQAAETVATPDAPSETPTTPTPPASASPPFNLADDMAGIIEGQADVLAQRLVYHCQTMYGVGSVGVDIVNARNSVLVLVNSIRNHNDAQAEKSLIGMGDPQIVQINDATLPFKNNGQVAGLLEGLVLDTISRAYASDPSRVRDARTLLDGIFQPANEQMQGITRMLSNLKSLGPGATPATQIR